MSKSIFTSKTFWLNLIAGLIAIIGGLNPDMLMAFGVTNPAHFMQLMAGVVTIMNFILRLLTDTPAHIITPTPTDQPK